MSNYLDRISVSGTVYPLVDSSAVHSLEGYYTSAQTNTAIASSTSGFADSVFYNTTSKYVEFYHDNTKVYEFDATDFVKDGFLSGVTLENRTVSGESVPCLVFDWNTDAGIQETVIPVKGTFDPTNYYTKSETDTAISAATSGKADTTTVTAHTADTTIHVTSADKSAWNAKSDFSGSYNDLTDKPAIPNVPTVSGSTLIL